jgi:hypothetical protein
MQFPMKRTTFSRHGGKLQPSPLQPVLPLLPEVLPTKDQDKAKFVSFELKSRAGQPAGSTTYKKLVRVFEEVTPQQWINLIRDVKEIWTQNTVNGPTERTSTIRALLKGKSLTAFNTALEYVRVDPNPNVQALVPLTVDHIRQAMNSVATAVFSHRALEIQKLWMNRGMRKPYNLSTRKTAAVITKINNSLPLFPLGNQDSKFSDQELVGLLKWSLPAHWRKKFDLDEYIPTLGTKAKLISEWEAIERNEIAKDKERKDDNDNNNNKKNKFGKFVARAKKDDRSRFFVSAAGATAHMTPLSFFLKIHSQWFDNKNLTSNDNASKKEHPFSWRTFRKEVNTLARKASKKNALGLYASALKRQQDKESKGKQAKRRAIELEDSSVSKDSMSVHNLEKPIPRKKNIRASVAKTDPKNKLVKKADGKKKNDEIDIGFLSAVKKMQLEDDYDMLDLDDDVLSLDDAEEVSITSADI